MPRNSKKCKQRALDLEATDGTVISNLAANEDNNRTTQMDRLNQLQDMFANRLDADLIRDVFHTCADNFDKTLESLLELCDNSGEDLSNDLLPLDGQHDEVYAAQALLPLQTIAEVPRTLTEPPLAESTNYNTRYSLNNCSTSRDSAVQVLNLSPSNAINHKSPLNAMMPFANLFAPKTNYSFNNNIKVNNSSKSSQPSKAKEMDLKEEIKQMIQNSHKVLVLMRGLPGSGKTTLANFLVYGSDGIILSTDDYFINNGNYNFDANQLSIAHEWNLKRAKKYIENGKTPVVIDNTNLEGWEMKPYVSLGYQKDYKIYLVEPDTHWSRNPKELAKRNIHGIPKEKLELMTQKFEKLTVEDMIKSLPSGRLIQKSNSDQKVNKKMVSTNAAKQIIIRSSSSPSNAFSKATHSDYDESIQSSAQLTDMTSNSSPNSTEPTSPVTDNQIDIDLLLALHQRSTDSEDTSSVNASEGGSSCGQESGWERDDEFTYAQNQLSHEIAGPSCSSSQPTCGAINELNTISESELELNARIDSKQKNEIKNNSDCIEDKNVEELGSTECVDDMNGSDTGDVSAINKRMFGLVGVPKHNWEFPPFPTNDQKNTSDNGSEICITYYSRSSQTELKDWALLELKQCNKDSNEGLETEDGDKEDKPIETKIDPKKSEMKVRLDKSTTTNDFPDDLSRDQKLNTLREKFPKAESNHLNEILDACHEDYKWAEKLLSELNDDHFDVSGLEQLSPTNSDRMSSPDVDSELTSNSGEEDLLVNHKDSEEPEFVLTIDPLLAAQLQSHFGDISDSMTENDLTVTLSHGVAHLLHHTLKKSLNQKSSAQNSSKPQSIQNNTNSNRLKKVPNNGKKKKEFVLQDNTPKSELQEIMDLELAKEMSRREYDNNIAAAALNSSNVLVRQEAKDLFSTKLKRDQLYQRYPGVDQNFLDSIFDSNKYYLGKTIDCLDNSLGLGDDFSREIESLIAQERNGISSVNGSRSTSPVKQSVRKSVDKKAIIALINEKIGKKKEMHDKARLAFQRRLFAVASYYGEEAMKLQRQADRLGAEVVDEILANSSNSNELDLHGLHIPEVNSILSQYFNRKYEELVRSVGKRKLTIDIITGYGATIGVQGRIKPTVIQYLKQKNLTYEMVNMGVIRVTLF